LPSRGGVKLVKHGQRPNQFGGALEGYPLEVPPICGPLGTLACLRVRGQPRQLPSSRVELITTFSPPPPLHAGGGRRHCAPHCPRTRRHARVPKGPQIGGASNGDPSNAPPNWFGRCPCFTNLTPPPDGNAASGRRTCCRPEAALPSRGGVGVQRRRWRPEAALPSRGGVGVQRRRCRPEAALPSRGGVTVQRRRCRPEAALPSRGGVAVQRRRWRPEAALPSRGGVVVRRRRCRPEAALASRGGVAVQRRRCRPRGGGEERESSSRLCHCRLVPSGDEPHALAGGRMRRSPANREMTLTKEARFQDETRFVY
jgi:hypothetical protein